MNHKFTCILAGLLLIASCAAHAGPEEDRKALLEHYRQTFPNIKFDDYVYGALAMNPEAKAQYDNIMDFPSFANDVRQGGIQWEKPFRNGESFSSCFKHGGNNVAANYHYFEDTPGRLITFENAINDCLKTNKEKEIKYGSVEMTLLTA